MESNALVTFGLPAALFIIMTGMGMSLTGSDFERIRRYPKAVFLGSLAQLLLVPALGFAIGYAAGGGVLAAGIVLVAALPGGTTSNILTYLARGNLALSITLTVIASLAVMLTLPFYLNLALTLFVGEGAELALPVMKTLITIFVIVVLPVGVGMMIRQLLPVFAARSEKLIGVFSTVILLVIIIGIVVAERANILTWLAAAAVPVFALNILALGVGFAVGKVGGLSFADALTLAIETGIKNTTLGLAIALSILNNTELSLPAAVYGLMMYGSVLVLAIVARRVNAQPAS